MPAIVTKVLEYKYWYGSYFTVKILWKKKNNEDMAGEKDGMEVCNHAVAWNS